MLKQPGVMLAALIILACLFGGGGSAYGLSNLVVQLAALAAAALMPVAFWRFGANAGWPLALLAIATLLLPLVQLVPLPPDVWTVLPGRTLITEAVGAAGAGAWRPLTVNVARTLVAFIALLAPFAVLAIGLAQGRQGLELGKLAVVAAGVASVLLGTLQVLGQHQFALLYPEIEMPGVLFGFFANRNSTAIFLVACLLVLCSFPSRRPLSPKWFAQVVAAVLIVTGVVLTQSRTGLVLLALPAGLMALRMLVGWLERRGSGEQGGAPLAVVVATLAALVLGLGAIVSLPGTRVETVLARFEKGDEQRPAMWEDARYAVGRYWPAGAGMGTFDEVFQLDESLENISPRRAGRAHNDYLELAIEAGPAGLVLAALWALWVLWAAWAARGTPQRWSALAGAGILLAIALQSLLDYPLRNQTMLCIAAFAVLLLASARKRAEPQGAAA